MDFRGTDSHCVHPQPHTAIQSEPKLETNQSDLTQLCPTAFESIVIKRQEIHKSKEVFPALDNQANLTIGIKSIFRKTLYCGMD